MAQKLLLNFGWLNHFFKIYCRGNCLLSLGMYINLLSIVLSLKIPVLLFRETRAALKNNLQKGELGPMVSNNKLDLLNFDKAGFVQIIKNVS